MTDTGGARPRLALYADNLYSGVGRHTARLMEAFDRAGIDAVVRALVTPDSRPLDQAILGLPSERLSVLTGTTAADLTHQLSQDRDLTARWPVLVKGGPANGSVPLLRWLRKQGSIVTFEHNAPPPPTRPRIGWSNGRPSLGLWWWRREMQQQWRWRQIAAAVAVSDWVAHRLVELWGAPRARVSVATAGVDSARFRFNAEAAKSFRSSWGLGDGEIVVGSIGQVSIDHKGFDLLVAAFAAARRALPEMPLRLVMVGAVEADDSATIQALVSRHGLEDVVLFPGRTTEPHLAWSAFDVVVLASRFEGFSLSLLEAMSCERAVLATDVGGAKGLVEGGRGCLVPPDDLQALSAALTTLVASGPSSWVRLGRLAREKILAEHQEAPRFDSIASTVAALAHGTNVR